MWIDDTIAAISSPPGSAARGILRLSGPDAIQISERVFVPDGAEALSSAGHACHVDGVVRIGGVVEHNAASAVKSPGENRIGAPGYSLPAAATTFRGPRSYTGQDIVELHMLGSPGVLALVLEALLDAGARRAEPGEFTARAYLAGRMDLAQVHGVAAMIAARSDAQLQAAERLLHGALSTTANDAREQLADLLSLVEGALDFADEPIEFITPRTLRQRLEQVRIALQAACDAGLRAERWGRLPRVVLVGSPNAGKSSLLNRLTGIDRAIRTATAGTTRDVLTAPLQLAETECLLVDAAGLHDDSSPLDAMAQRAATEALAAADLILRVIDVTRPDTAERSAPIDGACPAGVPVIAVANKIDLVAAAQRDRVVAAVAVRFNRAVCAASAVTGMGCDALKREIERRLHGRAFDADNGAIALMSEHRAALQEAITAIKRALALCDRSGDSLDDADLVAVELHAAADHLATLVGRDLPDDLLGRVFARFCVGK